MSETTSQAFLGMSITCAHCHNHPLEKWTNDQYYGMANLFARLKIKNADGEGNLTVFPTTEGEVDTPAHGGAPPAAAARWRSDSARSGRRSAAGAGRLAHRAGEPLFQ